MNELIRVTTNEQGSQVVSARELHEFLEVKTPFEKWIPRMLEYGFSQGADYQQLDKIVQVGNGAKRTVVDDYALILDTAKEISMIQRTEKGKQARQYFIEMEKRALRIQKQMSIEEMIIAQAQSMIETKREVAELKETVRQIDARTQTRPNYFTVVGYATLNGMQVGLKVASSVGQRASRICKERGILTETCSDPRFGKVNMYPNDILKEVFAMPIV